MTAPVLFRNVRLLDLDAEDGMTATTELLVQGGSIAATAPQAVPDNARVIEGNGDLLMPGLINAHFHSSVNHMKGRLPCLPLELFMLYESPALDTLRPTPRQAYLRTMLGCIEMLRAGTTAVMDDCFFVPEPTPEIIDAVAQAYTDSGIRATLALDEPELSELEKLPFLEEIAPEALQAGLGRRPRLSAQDLLGLYDHLIGKWHGTEDGRIGAAVSCSAPQRVSPEYFAAIDALSAKHDLPVFAHMLETRLQRVLGQEKFGGRSLVRYTSDLGLLSDRMQVIHAIWVDADDLDLIAEAGANIAHNPISNLRLGSGVMPLREMLERGITVSLGVDEAIADDAVNMWSVMKTAGMIHTLSGDDPDLWPTAREVLRAATVGGGAAMRRPGLGTLEVGAPADLILVDLSSLAFLPLNDLVRQLVHVETGTSVRLTMVAGRVVADNGHVTSVDEAALLDEAREVFGALAPVLRRAAEEVSYLLPVYRAMHDRAVAVDVDMTRKLGKGLA
ncbi:5-methylthioadenosine/S-adenosylhomocysteine deaminase [Roseivivax lentus]|uniref:5-methylthioadenosine/S-adenosylhomocysteine deaminase n=1 Tax=Roseivivax lentus TaxID=633194 RepID=A0A1N7NTP2_9RHOB|nr:amidohydrolase family protein [Roseivivax lentus]SIT01652.1 5-methylthioadenosine/S-adenosylhomocysteine deaminase [Roseivivax lentus]